MKNSDVVIRPATRAQLESFYGKPWRQTALAWLVTWKGRPACVAGLAMTREGTIAFSDVKPGIDAPKITIFRTMRALHELMKQHATFMIAGSRDKGDHSRVLEMLGFKPWKEKSNELMTYAWRK